MNLKYYLRGLGIGIVVTALLMGFALKGTKESLTDDEVISRAEQLGMVQSGVLSKDLQNTDETVSGDHVNVVKDDTTESEKAAEAEKIEDMSNPTEGTAAETEAADNHDAESEKKEEDSKNQDSDAQKITDNKGADKKETTAENDGKESDQKVTDSKNQTSDAQKITDNKGADKKETTAENDGKESDQKVTDSRNQDSDAPKTTENKETDKKETEKKYTVTVYSGDDSLNVANRLEKMGIIKNAASFDEYLCRNGYDKHLATGSHTVKPGMSDKELAQALMRSEN